MFNPSAAFMRLLTNVGENNSCPETKNSNGAETQVILQTAKTKGKLNLEMLPSEILFAILSFLNLEQLMLSRQINKSFDQLVKAVLENFINTSKPNQNIELEKKDCEGASDSIESNQQDTSLAGIASDIKNFERTAKLRDSETGESETGEINIKELFVTCKILLNPIYANQIKCNGLYNRFETISRWYRQGICMNLSDLDWRVVYDTLYLELTNLLKEYVKEMSKYSDNFGVFATKFWCRNTYTDFLQFTEALKSTSYATMKPSAQQRLASLLVEFSQRLNELFFLDEEILYKNINNNNLAINVSEGKSWISHELILTIVSGKSMAFKTILKSLLDNQKENFLNLCEQEHSCYFNRFLLLWPSFLKELWYDQGINLQVSLFECLVLLGAGKIAISYMNFIDDMKDNQKAIELVKNCLNQKTYALDASMSYLEGLLFQFVSETKSKLGSKQSFVLLQYLLTRPEIDWGASKNRLFLVQVLKEYKKLPELGSQAAYLGKKLNLILMKLIEVKQLWFFDKETTTLDKEIDNIKIIPNIKLRLLILKDLVDSAQEFYSKKSHVNPNKNSWWWNKANKSIGEEKVFKELAEAFKEIDKNADLTAREANSLLKSIDQIQNHKEFKDKISKDARLTFIFAQTRICCSRLSRQSPQQNNALKI